MFDAVEFTTWGGWSWKCCGLGVGLTYFERVTGTGFSFDIHIGPWHRVVAITKVR